MPHPVKTAVLVTSGLSASALLLLLYLKRKKQQQSDEEFQLELESLTGAECNSTADTELLQRLTEQLELTDQLDLSDHLELPDQLELAESFKQPEQLIGVTEELKEVSEQLKASEQLLEASEKPFLKEEQSELAGETLEQSDTVSRLSERSQLSESLSEQDEATSEPLEQEELTQQLLEQEQFGEELTKEESTPGSQSESASTAVSEYEACIEETVSMADNNNDESVANNNLDEADLAEDEASAQAEGAKQLSVDCERVTKWLVKNEPFSQAGGREAASDDSGRPSSVDTETASPGRPTSQSDRSAKVVRGASPVPGDDNDVIHQFLIPNKLGGSMVGTRGRNINYIRAKSGASVWISRNFFDKKTQVVNVRGPVECVKSALQVIKKRFPELDVKPINTAVPIQRNPALQPTMCQLSMPVGVQVDVNVCAMCRGTTLFMQQPTHPSFHHLEKMDYTIMKHYADHKNVPALPRPVNPGAVCVAPFGNSWYRAIIADVYPEDDMVLMKYLDWGGYDRMPVGCLKQIRTEMMHLPFQAVEGHLAYVTPVLENEGDTDAQLEEVSRVIRERYLGGSRRIKCQVVYYNDVGQPCVYLYIRERQGEPWRFVQEELVQAGIVQWFQLPHLPPQMPHAN